MNPGLAVSAIALGLIGSSHCVLMCGGVVAMSCAALPRRSRSAPSAQLATTLAFNAGRIASYSLAGAAAGALGASLGTVAAVASAQAALRVLAGVMMVLVGLYVGGFSPALTWAERLGAPLWRRIAPIARTLVPLRSPGAAVLLGALWGWMPCGLVYASLAGAVTSGSALSGTVTMAAFGLGTLPTLLAMGSGAALVARAARRRSVRVLAGVALLLLGLMHTGQALGLGGAHARGHCCPPHEAPVALSVVGR